MQGLHLHDPLGKFTAGQLTKVDTVLNAGNQITYYNYHNPDALKLNDHITLSGIQIGIYRGYVGTVLLFYKKSDQKAIKAYFDRQFGEAAKMDGGRFLYDAAHSSLWLLGKTKGGRYVIDYTGPSE